MVDSSKPISANPGSRTFARGIVTIEEKNFSKLVEMCKSNAELQKSKNFEKMYYARYGPYTVGNIELEIRMYPIAEETVEVHVCLLRNAELVTRFFHTLMYYHNGVNQWVQSYGGQKNLQPERDFKAGPGSIGEGLGLPMVYLDYFTQGYATNDTVPFEVAFWFILDDTKESIGANLGSRTFARGIVTVEEKNFSKLVAKCKSNAELQNSKCFEKMYYARYGPYTVGNIELEIRMYPVAEETVEVHVCLLRNAEVVKKFFHTFMYYHKGSNQWVQSYAGQKSLQPERDFKVGPGSIGEGLSLPMVYLDYFTQGYATDDTVLFEVAFWFVLEDTKKPRKCI